MKGRKPKPLELHEANGNPSKKNMEKAKAQTPRAPDSNGHAPDWISDDARKHWLRLFPVVQKMRVMTEADETALAELCEQIADVQHYRKLLRDLRKTKEGDLVMGSTGNVMLHPYGKALAQSTQIAKAYMTEFGLTPASRTRINVENETQADGLLKFVGGLN